MSTNRDFFMTIPDASLEDWELFIKKADMDETYPADILLDFVRDFIEEHRADLTEDSEVKPKKVLVKKAPPKKKSFLARKAKIVRKKEPAEDSPLTDITQTPKFKLLELARELDVDGGISPDDLVLKAEASGIARPRLQMNKMIRRGILYIHKGMLHVT